MSLFSELTNNTDEISTSKVNLLNTTRCLQCEKLLSGSQVKKCSSCKLAAYCSQECQKIHWKIHKINCVKKSNITSNTNMNNNTNSIKSNTTTSSSSSSSADSRTSSEYDEERLPFIADYLPSTFTKYQYIPSVDNIESNLVILFHGNGDNLTPYSSLSKSLRLPQTAYLTIQAPLPLPVDIEGFTWYRQFETNGELIKPSKSELRRLTDLKRVRLQLFTLLDNLIHKCKWQLDRIFLLGFSAGAYLTTQ